MLILCCAIIALALAATARASLVNNGVHLGRFAVFSWVVLLMWWLVHAVVKRREERAADELAATVFGEVLTDTRVQLLRRHEGRLPAHLPTFVLTHPHPEQRRRASAAALGDQ